jgi:hypothetical protein
MMYKAAHRVVVCGDLSGRSVGGSMLLERMIGR